LNGYVNVVGQINSSGLSNTSNKSATPGGNGGAVLVQAPAFITIGGVVTSGGNTIGTGNGGNAGAVSLSTATVNGVYDGNVAINGYINSTGGNAVKAHGTAGAGASVSINSGALQVTSSTAVNGVIASINSSGGTSTKSAQAGAISIKTYAVQLVPSNFNLTSSVASEYALPGGLFTVGTAAPVNGTASSIAGGTSIEKTGNLTVGNGFAAGSVSVTANPGDSATINIAASKFVVSAGASNAARTKLTPAEALALYQVSFGNTQTIGLNAVSKSGGGQATDKNVSTGNTPSTIVIPEYDLPFSGFKTFVLSNVVTTGNLNDFNLQITGLSPVLNIAAVSSRTINGEISFTNANTALINAGSIAMNIGKGAVIISAGQLALQGSSTWTNNGSISAAAGDSIIVINPAGSFTLSNTSTGVLSGSNIELPANAMPTAFTFTNANNTQVLPTSLSNYYAATGFGTIAQNTLLPGAVPTAASSLSFTMGGSNGVAQITGQVSASIPSLTIITNTNSTTKATTDLVILPGTNLNLSKSLSVTSSGAIVIGAATSAGVAVSAASVTMTATGSISSTALTLSSTSSTPALSITTNNGSFTDNGGSTFNSAGALNLTAQSITIGGTSGAGTASNFNSTTGMSLVASVGSLSLNNASALASKGGTLLLQAAAVVNLNGNLTTGSTGLPSSALINTNVSSSGAISIKSGTTAIPGGLNIAGGLSIQASGTTTNPGNINALVTNGDINFLGTNTTMQANGGNLVLLTTGTIDGTNGGNNFGARGIALSATNKTVNVGGGIELGAGTSTSKLAAAIALPSGKVTPSNFFGSGVTIINGSGSHGVISANAPVSAVVNLTEGQGSQAFLDVSQGGAIVFDASSTNVINLDGGSFTTQAYKPIAYKVGPETEIEIAIGSGSSQIANLIVPGVKGATPLFDNGQFALTDQKFTKSGSYKDINFDDQPNNRAVVTLRSGTLFMNTLEPLEINVGAAKIFARKGSLSSISNDNGLIRIIACSGPGDLTIQLGPHKIALAPGEEILLSDHKPEASEILQEDGIGRRFTTTAQLSEGIFVAKSDVSLITMLANQAHLRSLVRSNKASEKAIATRILKTAAVLGQVTNNRGSFVSRSNKQIRAALPQEQSKMFVSMGAAQ